MFDRDLLHLSAQFRATCSVFNREFSLHRSRKPAWRVSAVRWIAAKAMAAAVLLLVGGGARASAQSVTQVPSWTQLSPATSPVARAGGAMAYDAASGQLLLFGGGNGSGLLGDTWTWNGVTWTQLTPATSPSARAGATMAYDSAMGQVVLFGGGTGSSNFNDTWAWNGATWTQLSPATSPSGRVGASMAYDVVHSQVVLFGGDNGSNILNDTWTWDGTSWTRQNSAISPSERFVPSMTYDTARNQLVLFGGGEGSGGYASDTWTWDGSNWIQLSPAASPSARAAAAMAYDGSRSKVVLFGGADATDSLSDTWTWDGSTWTQLSLATSPAARETAVMAYDTATGQVVLFAGSNSGYLNDTWTLQGGAMNLGTANVCPTGATSPSPCSQTATVWFSVGAGTTIGSINVLTQGAPGLDFAANTPDSSTTLCKAQTYTSATTCSVDLTFAPKYPGQRMGAVVIEDGSNAVLASVQLYGAGTGPQIAYSPGTVGTLASGFAASYGVAVDGAGNLYVGDNGYNPTLPVSEIPVGCTSVSCGVALGGGYSFPGAVAVDGSGNVYVADTNHDEVKKMPPGCGSASCTTTLGGTGSGLPGGIAVDQIGNVFVAYSNLNLVEEIPLGCTSTSCVTALGGSFGFLNPTGVAVDGSGKIYVADSLNSAVEVMTPGCASASCVTKLGGTFAEPVAVAVDASGSVYVAEYASGAVKVMPAGCANASCVTTLSTAFNEPAGLALDRYGNIYVANKGNGVISVIARSTPPLLTFTQAVDSGSTSAQLSATVSNIGNATLTAVAPGLSVAQYFTQEPGSGTPSDCTTGFSLTAGTSCNLSVEFAPTGSVNGTVVGSVTLTDNNLNAAPKATQTIFLVGTAVSTAPTITSASGASFTLNTPSSFTVTTTGTPAPSLALTFGNLPLGLLFQDNGNGTASLSGVPIAGTAAIYPLTITASNSVSPKATQNFTLTVNPAVTATQAVPSTQLPLNQPVTPFTPVTGGGGTVPFNYGISPSLPAGLNFSTATGAITGTPTAISPTAPYTVTVVDANGAQAGNTFSLSTVLPTIVVTTLTDDASGVVTNCTDSTVNPTSCTLRDAMATAAAESGFMATPPQITFASALDATVGVHSAAGITPMKPGSSTPGVYSLAATGALNINTSVNIVGPGANLLSIDGGNLVSVFSITGGTVSISGLTISNGNCQNAGNPCNGGGIYNSNTTGSLTLTNVAIVHNIANGYPGAPSMGGGVYNDLGSTLTVVGSTISGNTSMNGGGIGSYSAVTVTDSTFSGNHANWGGGIYIAGTSPSFGVPASAGTLTVTDSTFGGDVMQAGCSTCGGAISNDNFNTTVTLANNLFGEDINGSITNDDGGNVYASAHLSSLGYYGGSTQTMLPLPGSAGICAGTQTPAGGLAVPTLDQRGNPRTTGVYTNGDGDCLDAGAVQTAYSLSFLAAPTSQQNAAVTLTTAPVVQLYDLNPATGQAAALNVSGAPIALSANVGTLSGTTSQNTVSTGAATYNGIAVNTAVTLTNEYLIGTAAAGPYTITANSNQFGVLAMVLPTTTLAAGQVGVSYTPSTINPATGGIGNITYSASGLPTGLTLSSAGVLSGTPTVGRSTAFSFTITATDSNGDTATQGYSLLINVAVVGVTPATLTDGSYGANYSQSVAASGGIGPYAFALAGGSQLPAGLSLSSSGVLTGTPTAAGSYSFTVVATDTNSSYNGSPSTGSTLVSLAIDKVRLTVTAASPTITYGQALPTYSASYSGLVNGDPSSVVSGAASLTSTATANSGVGQYPITTAIGTLSAANYTFWMVNGTLSIQKATPSVVLSSNNNPAFTSNAVTLTATVGFVAAPAVGTLAGPTGHVAFYDGGVAITGCTSQALGANSSNGSATASCALSSMASGSHSITAVYTGDGNFAGPASATPNPLTEVVADFTINAQTATITALPNSAVAFTFTVSPVSPATTFPAAINFALNGLPTGYTYTLTPSSLAANTGTATLTLTIQVPQATAMQRAPSNPWQKGAPFAMALLLLPFAGRLRRAGKRFNRMLSILLLMAASVSVAAGLSGCGSTIGFFGQPMQSYTVNVSGNSGTLSRSTTVTLTVE
jgi:hypothetical protein